MKIQFVCLCICSALLSSCAISSFSNRTTNKNLYQHGHFKKPKDFKFKRTRNEQKQFIPTDNSTLDISKELGIKQDSTISEEKPLEIALPILKKEINYKKEHKLIDAFENILKKEKDTTSNDVLKKTKKMGIIGAVFAHVAPLFYVASFLFISGPFNLPLIGLSIIILGFLMATAALIMSILTLVRLIRAKQIKNAYFPIAIVSILLAGLAALIGLIGLLGVLIFAVIGA